MKNYNINLTNEDIQKLIGALDLAVKNIGLNAVDLIILAQKIDAQVKEQTDGN